MTVQSGAHIAEEDLALYAMGSLLEDKTGQVRAHVASCTLCQRQIDEIYQSLALLALSVEQQSLPSGARERFLAKLDRTPQSGVEPAAAPQKPQIPEEQLTLVSASDVVPPPRGRLLGLWVPWALAAALAIVAIGLGVQTNALNDQLRDESNMVSTLAAKASRAQQVLEVLTSPRSQRVVLTAPKATPEPEGRASYLPDRGGLVFAANDLKPLPKGKIYELWVIPANGKAPIPAGIFRPDAQGAARLLLPPLPVGVPAKALGVTVENAGGSSAPTPPILLMGSAPGE